MQSTHSPQYQPLLQQYQLARFEQLWNYQGDWFEPPNRERGGWSGVNYIELADEAGVKHGFYLKRQQAHMRRTWRHPIAGEPTFVREFEILQHLSKYNVATPKLVFFGSQQDKAILLTEALIGFVAADEWLKSHADISINKQRVLMRALAVAVHNLHQARVQHRSLYLKHLFVKEKKGVVQEDIFEVATIDFEKSRITAFIRWLRLADLITLHYRTADLRAGNKLTFFKQYFAIQHLTPFYKALCRYLHQQSLQKRR
ncbi:MAG: lipopolysaccharide kinase InaA family protein [Methylotenera sp.]|nr:lipopolysaccharide kinase InaA family protein [Methylotenera sp.]OQW69023.1 MAG: hypothetical protein BVN34_05775 [Proteobacteria bacterium ST_bin12]